MFTRHGAVIGRCAARTLVLALGLAVTASGAINVTFQPIARTGDAVPGQTGTSGFTSQFSRPSVNDAGVVVFAGVGPSSAGIYAKTPSGSLIALLDQTLDGTGALNFPVPGQPAGTVFNNFLNKAPLINNAGDVVFFAGFARPAGSPAPLGGNGIYATSIATPGTILKLVDSTDPVPNSATASFEFFEFSSDTSALVASLDNTGNVVIFARFTEPSGSPISALYATTVAGGALSSLVDGGGTVAFTPSTLPNRDPNYRLVAIQSEAPALNNTGSVVFRGTAKIGTALLPGAFSVPVNGSSDPTIVAVKFDSLPRSVGGPVSFGSAGGVDVNDAGQVLVRGADIDGTIEGIYLGDVSGEVAPGVGLELLVDDQGGFPVPGRTSANFTAFQGAALNESGQFGFLGTDDGVVINNGAMYAADTMGTPLALVANTFGIAPPGRPASAILQGFSNNFRGPAINDGGNMAFGANGSDGVGGIVWGLYFYNSCAGVLERIADDTTSLVDLGGNFASTGNRGFQTFTDLDTRSGHYRSINNSNDVAFKVEFSNFDEGIYLAAVTGVGGGSTTIICPADLAQECPADTSVGTAGTATATDGCSGATLPTTFADANVPNCGSTETITRTWSADDGAGGMVSCDQIVSTVDTTAPTVTCPADIAVSGGFGGRAVSFSASATDACDANPSVAATPISGSFFPTGVTTVSATATDACANTSSACSFDVSVSCFGVNRAKIGTKDQVCRGIESIEFTSMDGTEELISLFKAEEGSGGAEEDTLPTSIVVDDGVNGPVTVDTSCGVAIQIGDVFGPYTVSDIDQDFDDHADNRGNDVQVRGSFVPAIPFDLAVDDFDISIDDGQGNVAAFTIPAGSFVSDGNPAKGKFKFEGNVGTADVKVKLKGCKVEFKAKNATNTAALIGTALTIRLTVGPNTGEDTLAMENKGNHLKFKRHPKVNCCPSCHGVASMQVTSDQGVLVFVPDAGKTKLHSNTVVDDGVNGSVTIHTSCSQPIAVGDAFGAYMISEVIKIYDGN